ncbi:hypothetical protein [Parenemella sanctibonifatiensis]|uniref:Uncharacterized protein n=1 Tax=Parenemella sanctibonifatiensis TaxID=2016505 RepID=A0A255ECS1_9ACTN|nr:hypothetical protein [Parenemella sanctibonifatiensis]OYN89349.1 hypothetical protein CGZ91_10620 [Parenemella sanctibonifatiensis]
MSGRFMSEFTAGVADMSAGADHAFLAEGAGARSTFVVVEPWGAQSWSATFAAPDPGRRALSALLGTPNPTGLCVVERGTAFLGDVLNPASFEAVPTMGPVVAAEELEEERVLLLVGPWTITAVSSAGVLWETRRLAIDGLRVAEASGGWVRGASDPDDGEPREFAVELATGQVAGGATIA